MEHQLQEAKGKFVEKQSQNKLGVLLISNSPISNKKRIFQKSITPFSLDVAEKSDTAYGEVAHNLSLVEIDLEKAEERGEMAETKSSELEEELKNLANNLR